MSVKIYLMNKFLIIIIFTISNLILGQESKYLVDGSIQNFTKGEVAYIFENKTKLYLKASCDSKVIDKLNTTDKVKILDTVSNKNIDGLASNWCLINYNDKIGYVKQDDLSLESVFFQNYSYFIAIRTLNDSLFLKIKLYKSDSKITESMFKLQHFRFYFKVHGNKGVNGVKSVIIIDYNALMTGENFGATYIFNSDSKLLKIMDLKCTGFPLEFMNVEKLIFPIEKDGKKGKIIHVKENLKWNDEKTNYTETNKEIKEFIWINNQLIENTQD